MKRFTIFAGAIAVTGLLVAGCAAEEAPTKVGAVNQPGSVDTTAPPADAAKTEAPKQTEFKVGDKVEANNNVITVYSVAGYTSDSEYFQPDPGTEWVAADVEACAGPESKNFSINPFEFELQLADNTRAESNFMSKDPSLNHTELSPGDCVRGFISYEVPTGKKPIKFIYNELTFFSGAKIKWVL